MILSTIQLNMMLMKIMKILLKIKYLNTNIEAKTDGVIDTNIELTVIVVRLMKEDNQE